jgi:predicted amidohydrolase YtcJ
LLGAEFAKDGSVAVQHVAGDCKDVNGGLCSVSLRCKALPKAVRLDAAYSLQLEKNDGSLVPGKLANFMIPSENPLTSDPIKIKDIAVWRTVQEGRELPVKS